MPGARKNFMGLEGFVWYIGVVEDRNDPEKLGRVRVRCFGWHTSNKSYIPTADLPWAHSLHPINSSNMFHTPKEGDMVFGFFADADSAQNPVVLGVFPGKPQGRPDYEKGFSDPGKKYPLEKRIGEPTTNRLSRGRTDDTVIERIQKMLTKGITTAGGGSWSQPAPSYGTVYPKNCAHETESGHAFELDDTPGKERVNLAHKIGTYIEMDAKGNRVEKVVKDNYTLVMGDDHIFVSGRCDVTVGGDCNLMVGGKLNVEASEINMSASGDVNIKGSSVNLESVGEFNVKSGDVLAMGAAGEVGVSGGIGVILQGMVIDLTAPIVNIQSSTPAPPPSGTGLSGGIFSAPGSFLDSMVPGITKQMSISQFTSSFAAGTLAQSDLIGGMTGQLTDTLKGVTDQLPLGDIQEKMLGSQIMLTDTASGILDLPDNHLSNILSLATDVSDKAATQGLNFNMPESLASAFEPVVSDEERVLGKRLFPRTESLTLEEIAALRGIV